MQNLMDECKPNSHKYKKEQANQESAREVEQVTHGVVKTRKKTEVQKFKNSLLSEDSLIGYFLNDMILPAVKRMASDVFDDFVDYMKDSFDKRIYGESKSSGRRSYSSHTKTSYGKYFSNPKHDREPVALRAKSGFDYDQIFFKKRGDADAVLEEMYRLIQKYKVVSVADMYRAANMDWPFTYDNYGWMDISEAKIVREYYDNEPGYIIDLPRPMPLD